MKLKKEGKGMNKGLRIALLSCIFVAIFILTINIIFRDKANDFFIGCFEGISISLVVLGVVYLLWCAIKKCNPLKPIKR